MPLLRLHTVLLLRLRNDTVIVYVNRFFCYRPTPVTELYTWVTRHWCITEATAYATFLKKEEHNYIPSPVSE